MMSVFCISEGIPDSQIKIPVTEPGELSDPFFSGIQSRVSDREGRIQPDQKEIKIKPYTQSGSDGHFFIKAVCVELSAGELFVLFQKPYVSGIHKKSPFPVTVHRESVFYVGFKLNIPVLVNRSLSADP